MDILSNRRWRVIVVLLIPVLVGFGPCTTGPRWLQQMPGGVVNGEAVSGNIGDWSFVADAGLCALETRLDFPHSITVYCFNEGPKLYVGCMGCEGKVWSRYVTNDNRARIKIADKVYPVTMNRIDDQDELKVLWNMRQSGRETSRPLPQSYWLFELTSR
ncbi:MAG: hypothetical protein ABGY96_04005 [bacterium]|nr:hypothetical protein [Gammaproteobacteria bacterium]HIL98827.1 hypothetical protein [Pseudomonadales bacterium]